MFWPAITGSGESVLVTDTSAKAVTTVVSVSELLAALVSVVLVLADAVLDRTVPSAAPGLTRTTSTNVGAAPAATLERVEVTVPLPPTGGVVETQPDGAVNETNVVLAGTASVSDTFCAGLGPALARVMV